MIEGLRNCDLIEGMDYIKTCTMCGGEGEYDQRFTAGCGGGYFTMSSTCPGCAGDGIRKTNNQRVPLSVLLQIETRRAAAIEKINQSKALDRPNQEMACDRSCLFWSYDMDGTYCQHPKSLEIAPTFGASTNRMSMEGHCMTDQYGNTPAVAYALWEPKETTSHG